MQQTRIENQRSLERYQMTSIGTVVLVFMAFLLAFGFASLMPKNVLLWDIAILPWLAGSLGFLFVILRVRIEQVRMLASAHGYHSKANMLWLLLLITIVIDFSVTFHLFENLYQHRINERINQSEFVKIATNKLELLEKEKKQLLIVGYDENAIEKALLERENSVNSKKETEKILKQTERKLRDCPRNYFKNCIDPKKEEIQELKIEISILDEEIKAQEVIINQKVRLGELEPEIAKALDTLVSTRASVGNMDVKPYDDIFYFISEIIPVGPHGAMRLLILLIILVMLGVSLLFPVLAPLAEEPKPRIVDESLFARIKNSVYTNLLGKKQTQQSQGQGIDFQNSPTPITATSTVTSEVNATSSWQAGFHDFQPRIDGNPDGNTNENNDRTDGNPNEEFSFGIIPKVPPQPQKKSVKQPAQKGEKKKFNVIKYKLFVDNYEKFDGVMAELMSEYDIPRTTAYNYRIRARKEGKIT
jgi:hypothetical protein